METRKDYISLNGVERVSLLLLALGEEQVQRIFEHLDESEIREIAVTMTNLGKVSSNVVEVMFSDFVDQLSTTGALIGTPESTKRLLTKALPQEKVAQIMEEISGPAGRTMWDKLSNINEELLANYLKNEYPQTISVVLTRIRPEHAARVMTLLPDSLVMEVIMRMLKMESVRREILDDIERTLRVEFMSNISKASKRDSYELVAEIFNFLDRQTEAKMIGNLEESSPDDAERIKNLMFTFDDMLKLDSQGIQAVVRVIDKTKLALALKGANDAIKEKFFSNMSERAGKLMREDMQSMGMVRVKDVDEAQNYIVITTKDLANRGEIVIRKGGDAEDALIG
ncbi:flagellar motor switch protein FliG [Candidatus Paracaedibacter acanthamoebae]|uniref:Flagellar motor switch protein FliG n=1 Tax=Candidatus Odyssella acanthamoebae TaxID=91604 RepID=A0A077ATM4_9PROT|nr:flagellar motor switch protein FliG [Candidatus Paracaedibacter acanthamoebae]